MKDGARRGGAFDARPRRLKSTSGNRTSGLEPHAESVTLGGGFAGGRTSWESVEVREAGVLLILNGHIDTVEIGDPAAWSHAPLGGDVSGDASYGRGACDMKGAHRQSVCPARAPAGGIPLAGDVSVQSTISEEDGGAGALAAVLRGYVADGALISEPTNLAIVTAQGGALMFRLQVHGLSAHACVRDEGVSAVEKFAYLHQGLLEFETRRSGEITHPLYDGMRIKAPINVGVVRGGSWALPCLNRWSPRAVRDSFRAKIWRHSRPAGRQDRETCGR